MPSENFFILVDAPESLEFGIDCMVFQTGPKFSGVSVIPAGLHFIYYSTGMGSRQGFFARLRNDQYLVRSWLTSTEEMSTKNVLSEGSTESLVQAVKRGDFNERLGPYNPSQLSSWQNLTGLISDAVLELADCGNESVIQPGDAEDLIANVTKGKKVTDSTQLKPYFPDVARVATFCDIDTFAAKLKDDVQRISDPALRQEKLTVVHRDKSLLLSRLVKSYYRNNWEFLLGELQLSFIIFMFIHSHGALTQWKRLLSMICQSEEYLNMNATFTETFTRIIYEQLNFVPEDFFTDELSRDNIVRPSLSSFFLCFRGRQLTETTQEHLRRLMVFTQQRFGLYEKESLPIFQYIPNRSLANLLTINDNELTFRDLSNANISDDLFNLMDDEMPVIVDSAEIETMLNSHGNNDYNQNQDQSDTMATVTDDSNITDKPTWKALDMYIQTQSQSGVAVDADILVKELIRQESNSGAVRGNTNTHTGTGNSNGMALEDNNTSLRNSQFEWRYPKLFECMASSPEPEDLGMTAARIIETHGYLLDASQAVVDSLHMDKGDIAILMDLVKEACMYIQEEMSR